MIFKKNGDIDFDAIARELRSPKVSIKRKNAICDYLAKVCSLALEDLEREQGTQ